MSSDFVQAFERLVSLGNLQLKTYTDSKEELARSMDRVRQFLLELGSPQKKLSFVHVAGTSGKGSVANYLHEILHADDRKVGTYTSPHTTSYLERFRTGELLIDPKLLTECIDEVIVVYQKQLAKHPDPMSYFELSTCLAFYAFAKAGMEWCVLETGCGGRWDATNVIQAPTVAVITNIDKDHTEILGNSLSLIAFEKAGIIKRGSTVFCGETRPALKKIFMNEAVEKATALFFIPPPSAKKVPDALGRHQQHNAALAEAAARELGISDDVIKKAFDETRSLPCRFETIQNEPLVILDGAHNVAKMKSTIALMQQLGEKAHIIFGCTATKDAEAMIDLLLPIAKTITTTRFTTTARKASNPALLLSKIPKAKRANFFLDPFQALAYTQSIAQKRSVLVTGSLYLAGELRSHWITEDQILKKRSSF